MRHVESASGAAGQQAFRDELLAGEHDRIARDPQLIGERARRRQAGSRLEHAEVHGLHQAVPDLGLEAQPAVGVDVEEPFRHEGGV